MAMTPPLALTVHRSQAMSRFDRPEHRPTPRKADLAICLILAVAIVSVLMLAL